MAKPEELLPQPQPPLQQAMENDVRYHQQQRQQGTQRNGVKGGQLRNKAGGFFQGGLDALVTSISVLGDTLGQALEDGIQHVATTGTDIITGLPEKKDGSGRFSKKPAGPDGVSSPRATKPATEAKEGKTREGNDANERPAIPKETQLMASRNVATAMATRAKQLQADLRTARREVATLSGRCNQLEEENARLQQELADGQHMGPTDAEEQLREQVEHLLQEKSEMARVRRELERENEQLHQILAYYEHMHVANADDQELADQGWDTAAAVLASNVNGVPVSASQTAGIPQLASLDTCGSSSGALLSPGTLNSGNVIVESVEEGEEVESSASEAPVAGEDRLQGESADAASPETEQDAGVSHPAPLGSEQAGPKA